MLNPLTVIMAEFEILISWQYATSMFGIPVFPYSVLRTEHYKVYSCTLGNGLLFFFFFFFFSQIYALLQPEFHGIKSPGTPNLTLILFFFNSEVMTITWPLIVLVHFFYHD